MHLRTWGEAMAYALLRARHDGRRTRVRRKRDGSVDFWEVYLLPEPIRRRNRP